MMCHRCRVSFVSRAVVVLGRTAWSAQSCRVRTPVHDMLHLASDLLIAKQ